MSKITRWPRAARGSIQTNESRKRRDQIMRIHEDGIYCSPDMIVKSGGFWITSSSMKPGESCSRQTALQPPIIAALDSDVELEELLKDTLEPSTPPIQSPPPPPPGPPLTPGAARITEEAVVD